MYRIVILLPWLGIFFISVVWAKSDLQLDRSGANDCKDVSISERVDLAGNINNINIFNIETGENLGTQFFDLVNSPPHNVCNDFGFDAKPINFLPSGSYSVVEHGPPYNGACDGQGETRAFNYNECRSSKNFVAEARFSIGEGVFLSFNPGSAGGRGKNFIIIVVILLGVGSGVFLLRARKHN